MLTRWKCKSCNHYTILNDNNLKEFNNHVDNSLVSSNLISDDDNDDFTSTKHLILVRYILCSNDECNNYSITTYFKQEQTFYFNSFGSEDEFRSKIINESSINDEISYKRYPPFIPKPILDDYKEAYLIKNLSPKASATLSRRCIQGMIRDFWKVSKSRLIDEIEAIKDKIDTSIWEAIQSVRKIGNIGAHMEKDINVIVEIDSNEAELLLGLIEILIEEWYINRHEREEKIKRIIDLASKKDH